MRERFVIVGGSPRSGTSLLRTILRSSSALVVHKTEPQYIVPMHRRFGNTIRDVPAATEYLLSHRKFPVEQIPPSALRDALSGTRTATLGELLRTCYRLLGRERPDSPIVLKDPSFLLHLELMKGLFPDLVVVHCVRDPRANAFSQRTRWPSTSVWASATGWQSYIDAGRAWQRKGGSPYLELRYEDLVTAPDESCRRLCDFIGIPFEPALLAFDHVERAWNPEKPGEGDKRHYQGFERQRIDKWQRFMTPVEIALIERHCRDGMALFGYERSDPDVDSLDYARFYLHERWRALRKSARRMKRRVRETYGLSPTHPELRD